MTAPVSRERVPSGLSRARLVIGGSVMVVLLAIPFAAVVYTFVYAVSGPSLPFLVNRSGPGKGPAPVGDRIQAAVLCVAISAAMLWFARQWVRRRVRGPGVAVDGRGVWLVRGGRHVQQGLEWPRIAAVNLVAAGEDTKVPANPPFLEIFTVDPIRESRSPLAARVVNAPPAAPGLRGKRYVLELTGPPEEAVRDLAAAVDGSAPGTRLDRPAGDRPSR